MQVLHKKDEELLNKLSMLCALHGFKNQAGRRGTVLDVLDEVAKARVEKFHLVEKKGALSKMWRRVRGRPPEMVLVSKPLSLRELMDHIIVNGTNPAPDIAAERAALQTERAALQTERAALQTAHAAAKSPKPAAEAPVKLLPVLKLKNR